MQINHHESRTIAERANIERLYHRLQLLAGEVTAAESALDVGRADTLRTFADEVAGRLNRALRATTR